MVVDDIIPDPCGYYFAIPIRFCQDDPLAAVAIQISKSHAYTVSAKLYETEKNDLSEQEVNDVCSEICNVLSACVCTSFSCDKEANLNLPQKLTSKDFIYIFKGSNLDKYFQAKNDDGAIVIYMFDPCNYFN